MVRRPTSAAAGREVVMRQVEPITKQEQSDRSEHHLLHLIQAHDVISPIIQLGCPRALMRRHLLRLLKIPAIGQVNRDPGRPEGMAADLRFDPGLARAPADHVEGVFPIQRPLRKRAGFPVGRSKQRALFVLPKAGRFNVGVQVLFERMVHRHLVVLAAFLMKSEPPPLSLGEIVLNPHCNRGADPREAVDQHANKGPIAKADQCVGRNAREELVCLIRRQDRGFAPLNNMAGPADD
jgi:hypothetical protein